jgi:type II secretion system protein J
MRAARAGFTLLEVLLAMTLMSMLAATLYASLHVAFRARDSVVAAGEESRAGQLALDMVRREMSEALPPKGILAGAFNGTDAQADNGADSDSVSFYAAAHTPAETPPEGDICLVEFALGTDDDGKTALVENTTTNLLAPETPTPTTEVLCRNVQALNLRYFDGTSWLDTWDSTQENDQPPLAIEVTLTLTAASGVPAAAAPSAVSGTQPAGRVLTRVVLLPCASVPQGNVVMPTTGRTTSTP